MASASEQDGVTIVEDEYGFEFGELFAEDLSLHSVDEWLRLCSEEGEVVTDPDEVPLWILTLLESGVVSEMSLMDAHLEAETNDNTIAASQLEALAEE